MQRKKYVKTSFNVFGFDHSWNRIQVYSFVADGLSTLSTDCNFILFCSMMMCFKFLIGDTPVHRSQSAADIIQEELQKVEKEMKQEAAVTPAQEPSLTKETLNKPPKES